MSNKDILTAVNRRGRTVLAKHSIAFGTFPVQYANNKQAQKKLEELGDGWEILQPPMFGRGLQIAKKLP
jgi:hypothetical protein